mmetsp:Transcript_6405/g.7263  ORF Transcript_6405/g.7263 Transcript_6405/m.7263 type:complete len:124 (+) Transcript_6405:208-579(+)
MLLEVWSCVCKILIGRLITKKILITSKSSLLLACHQGGARAPPDKLLHRHRKLYFFLEAFMAREYISVPAMAIVEPIIEPVLIGVLKAITEATMITTRLMVFPTACVTGLTLPRAKKATSLYA